MLAHEEYCKAEEGRQASGLPRHSGQRAGITHSTQQDRCVQGAFEGSRGPPICDVTKQTLPRVVWILVHLTSLALPGTEPPSLTRVASEVAPSRGLRVSVVLTKSVLWTPKRMRR